MLLLQGCVSGCTVILWSAASTRAARLHPPAPTHSLLAGAALARCQLPPLPQPQAVARVGGKAVQVTCWMMLGAGVPALPSTRAPLTPTHPHASLCPLPPTPHTCTPHTCSMSRLRQSLRRRLRRVDSPPLPHSRNLSSSGAARAAAHLPAIPEAWPPEAAAAAAAAEVPAAASAEAAAPTSASASASAAAGAAFEEVDLSEPAPAAPAAPLPRRFPSFSCACLSQPHPLR